MVIFTVIRAKVPAMLDCLNASNYRPEKRCGAPNLNGQGTTTFADGYLICQDFKRKPVFDKA